MRKFAKLFEFKDGQVLVIKEQDDETGAPCISTRVVPKGLDVCKTAAIFRDTEEGERKRDEEFERVDDKKARELADAIYKAVGEMS